MNFVEFQNSFQFNHKSFVRELVPACLLEKLGKTHLGRETFNNWAQIDRGGKKFYNWQIKKQLALNLNLRWILVQLKRYR